MCGCLNHINEVTTFFYYPGGAIMRLSDIKWGQTESEPLPVVISESQHCNLIGLCTFAGLAVYSKLPWPRSFKILALGLKISHWELWGSKHRNLVYWIGKICNAPSDQTNIDKPHHFPQPRTVTALAHLAMSNYTKTRMRIFALVAVQLWPTLKHFMTGEDN